MNDETSDALSVLYVDDDVLAGRVFARQMTKRGHKVDVVSSSNKAIAHVADETYDVVVSDLVMPGMDGIDLVAAMQAEATDAGFIIVSGMPEREVFRACETSGARVASILSKPFKADAMDTAIRQAAAGHNRGELVADHEGSVLVLDADKGEGLLASLYLERLGWATERIHQCTGLDDALEVLDKHPIDVIVADVDVADASSSAVVERLGEAAPNAAVVVLTGAPDERMKFDPRATNPGIHDVLKKTPLTYATLEHAIRAAVRHNESRRIAAASKRDPLTNTLWAPAFDAAGREALLHACGAEHTVAVISVGVANVDAVRKSIGDHAADQLLVHVSDAIELVVGDDVAVVRDQPSRFAILLGDVRETMDVDLLIARLDKALSSNITASGQRVDVEVALSYAVAEDGDTFDAVMARAVPSMSGDDAPWVVQHTSWFNPKDRGGIGGLTAGKLKEPH